MRFRTFSTCALVCACWLTAAAGVGTFAVAQDKKQADAKVAGGEREAAEKINKATGGEAKLQAAAEFVRKYPKSSLRPRVAEAVAAEIAGTQDGSLKISLAQTYLDFFNEPAEAEHVNGLLLTAMIDADRTADAFKLAPSWLEKHPDDVDTLRRLAIIGSNASIKGDNSFVEQAQQYGVKAAELIETDKKPAHVEAAKWTDYKAKYLPGLYREMGILALRAGDKTTGRTRLEKAVALNTGDPSVYAIVGQMADEDYTASANEYKTASGPAKDAALKKAHGQLDNVIDLYAHAVALSEGRPEYEQLRTQLMPALEEYYKFRHKNSTDGLRQLIDKYKKPATP